MLAVRADMRASTCRLPGFAFSRARVTQWRKLAFYLASWPLFSLLSMRLKLDSVRTECVLFPTCGACDECIKIPSPYLGDI
eukprot:scaffold310_cov168-Amphora_coffeaeformis.AAC.9